MQTGRESDCRNASHQLARSWTATLSRVLARCLFEILKVLRPVVLPLLFWLAVGGVGLWVVFVEIAHDDSFPTARVLIMSLGCLLGALGYCLLLESLRPASR